MLDQGREIYEQDRALYALCRPERLLELAYKFIMFDNGTKEDRPLSAVFYGSGYHSGGF